MLWLLVLVHILFLQWMHDFFWLEFLEYFWEFHVGWLIILDFPHRHASFTSTSSMLHLYLIVKVSTTLMVAF